MKLFLNTKILLAALLLVTTITSCVKNDDNYQEVQISGLSLIQASPTTEKLDVYVDNNKANLMDFVFGVKQDYLNAYAGNRTFQIVKKGATTALLSKTLKLDQGDAYALFLIDRLENINFLLLKDDLTIPPTGKAKVRFVNLSPDAVALGFAINGQTTDLSAPKPYKEHSDFINIDAGEKVTFNIKDETGVLVKALADVKIEAGKTYTVWTKGLKSSIDDTKFDVAIFTHK